MNSENPKIIRKYKKTAEKYVANRLIGLDEKRHDRIGSSEARAIIRAHKDGLSYLKIAELFRRDPRSVSKIIQGGKQGLLDLEILETGRRVFVFGTGEYARLIKFRIGNTFSNTLVVGKICLDVLDSGKHNVGLRIEGLIEPYKYDVELRIGDDIEYVVTEDNFKLPKNDFDDFEVLCTSQPGTIYQVRITVYYSEYPATNTIPQYSKAFFMEFPNVKEGINSEFGDRFKLIAVHESDYLTHLSDFIKSLSKVDSVDLRLYMEKPLSDDLVKATENELTKSGAYLCGPIRQDAGCMRITFRYNEALSDAIAKITLPTLLGWQVFDHTGNCLRGMRKFDNNVSVVEE